MCHASAGAVKAVCKRPYEKWSDAEEDTFFLALKATAGCLPNVVCTAAANRIGTKDYIQVMMQCHEHLSAVQDGCQSCGVNSLKSRLSVRRSSEAVLSNMLCAGAGVLWQGDQAAGCCTDVLGTDECP